MADTPLNENTLNFFKQFENSIDIDRIITNQISGSTATINTISGSVGIIHNISGSTGKFNNLDIGFFQPNKLSPGIYNKFQTDADKIRAKDPSYKNPMIGALNTVTAILSRLSILNLDERKWLGLSLNRMTTCTRIEICKFISENLADKIDYSFGYLLDLPEKKFKWLDDHDVNQKTQKLSEIEDLAKETAMHYHLSANEYKCELSI